jgi:hypothetical protein
MSDYDEGYQAGQHANAGYSYHSNKAAGSLLGLGLVLVVRLLPLAVRLAVETVAAAPLLLLGLALTTPLQFLGSGLSNARLLSIAAVAYLVYEALCWLKGVSIALRLRGGRVWLLPLAVCFTAACLVPALLLHLFIVQTVPTATWFVAWGLPVAFACIAYSRYRFLDDYAPSLVLWAYRMGYKAALAHPSPAR